MDCPMQIEFERRIHELGLSYSVNNENIYAIKSQTGSGNRIIVRFISSIPSIKREHESKNGNDVQAVGQFKFKFRKGLVPDILVFSFQNTVKTKIEFLIIPTKEFWRRHLKMNFERVRCESVEMVIWLMENGGVYDTTNISVEGEWYILSKGINGRMADKLEIDYTKFLDSWQEITGM